MNEHKVPSAPESTTVLTRMTCPACGKENAAVRYDLTLFGHGPGSACTGGEDVLSLMLAAEGLNVRLAGADTGTPWAPHPGNSTDYQRARALPPLARRVFVALQLRPAGITTWQGWAQASGISEADLRAGCYMLEEHGLAVRK